MKILYTCDNNYVWIMGISVISLFENNKQMKDLVVYLLGENISDNSRDALKEIADRYNREIKIIDVPKLQIPPSLLSERWPLSAFTRLFSAQLLPKEIDKVLYLDCDTIILGDIEPLEYLSFEDKIVVGVKDCISGTYKKNIGLDTNSPYVNAGVLLFNLNALRKIDINNEIEKYMNKYVKFINYADQDILNGMFYGKIGVLNPKYNVMTIDVVYSYEEIIKLRKPTNFYSKVEVIEAVKNPTIIHYTTNMLVVRPWYTNANHPLSLEFIKYLNISPWKDKSLSKNIFDSMESKIITIVTKLPKKIAYSVLGLIHSELKPRFIKAKAKMKAK